VLSLDEPARTALARLGHGPLPEATALKARTTVLEGLGETDPVPYVGGGRGLARTVAASVMANPADATELSAWADRLHVSRRTLQRDFEREYGSTFTAWRARHRLEASVPLLDLHPVTKVAHLVGYTTASAYVAAFRRRFGTTPGQRGGLAATG
jgi:AraC-like DNA-binding protein